MPASRQAVYSFVKQCSQTKDLDGARCAHSLMLAHGLQSSGVLCDQLLRLFGSCGSLLEANLVFSTTPTPTLHTWHAIISTQSSCGQHHEALAIFQKMQFEGFEPDELIYNCVLKACGKIGALALGRLVHFDTIRAGVQKGDESLRLVADMYGKCACFEDAYNVFKGLSEKSMSLWYVIISYHVEHGREKCALDLFNRILGEGLSPDEFIFSCILRACSNLKVVRQGFLVHSLIIIAGLECDSMLGNTLIEMYTRCGSLEEAQTVFDKVRNRDMLSWGVLMTGVSQNGNFVLTLLLFERMNKEGLNPSKAIYLCALKACTIINTLKNCMLLYDMIIRSHFDTDDTVADSVTYMFAKVGCLLEAQRVIEQISGRSIVAWNAIMAGHIQHGNVRHAVGCVQKMLQKGAQPDNVTYVCLLQAFSLLGIVEEVYLVHDSFTQSDLVSDTRLANTFIDVYSKFGRLDDAYSVFNNMPSQDAVSLSVIIAGYSQSEENPKVFELFKRINCEDIKVDPPMFVSVLKACTLSLSLIQGRSFHNLVVERSFDIHTIVGNALVDMYAKCGSLSEATAVFERLANRDVISWSVMISALSYHGHASHAISFFDAMQRQGFQGDEITLTSVVKACAMTENMLWGMIVHNEVVHLGAHTAVVVGNALVDFYMKCASLKEAHKIFDTLSSRDLVTWGAIIMGYVQHEKFEEALKLFERMHIAGMEADEVTISSILKALAGLDFLVEGMLAHDFSIRNGYARECLVGNALIDMYSKSGLLEDARKVFDGISCQDTGTWNAMISSYVQHNQCFFAIELFDQMHKESKKPDNVTYTCVLKACGCALAIKRGRTIYDLVIRTGDIKELSVGTTVVDMYANFGFLDEACRCFETLPARNVVSWNAMIAGYAQLGSLQLATECLQSMQSQGLKPDAWSYTSILSACSHEGLVKEGSAFFEMMKEDQLPMPSTEHFHCMIELLGSAGQLHEAKKLLQSMPSLPDMTGWMIMLGACKTFGDLGLGRNCFEQAYDLDSQHAASYVLMSKLFYDLCRWKESSYLHVLRKGVQAWKKPGQAWIEVNNKVHEFIVGETGHPQGLAMYRKLISLENLMISKGFVPQVDIA